MYIIALVGKGSSTYVFGPSYNIIRAILGNEINTLYLGNQSAHYLYHRQLITRLLAPGTNSILITELCKET